MKSFTFAAAALMAAVPAVYAQGSANVINKCSTPVYLWNVPAAGGGGVEVDQVIPAGGSYSQTYQMLTNGDGWSLKLSPTDNLAAPMQFEYTYAANTPLLWFDISYVNGDPFNGNWFLSTNSPACVPKQTYYRYSTDDSNGMQPGCDTSVDIILTICPGGSAAAPETSPSTTVPPAVQVAATTQAPATSAAPQVTTKVSKHKGYAPAFGAAGAPAVENIFTTFVTQIVTIDYTAPAKRAPEPTGEAKRDIHQHHHHHMRHHHARL